MILGASLGIWGEPVYSTSIKYKCLVDSFVYDDAQSIGVLDGTQVYYIDPFHVGTLGFF